MQLEKECLHFSGGSEYLDLLEERRCECCGGWRGGLSGGRMSEAPREWEEDCGRWIGSEIPVREV